MNQGEQGDSDDDGAAPRLPQLADLRAAVALLTAWRVDRLDIRSPAAAPATLFFPIVGGSLGLLLMGANWFMGRRLPAAASALVLVGLWEGLSGGAAWQACGARPDRGGGYVPLGMMLALLFLKAALLTRSVSSRPAALLFAPMLARWAMVVLAVGARDAAAPSHKLNAAITFREFAITSVCTCAVVFTVAEAFGILLVTGVAALTLGLRLLQHRRPGGTSWRLLLGSAELVELLVLGLAGLVGRR
jgi:cobalamin synthase